MRGLIEFAGFVLLFAVLLAVCGSLYVAAMAYFGRVQKGRCAVRRSRSGESIIETDLGLFTITGDGRFVVTAVNGSARSLPLAAVRAARFSYVAKPNLLAELAFGFNLWDLFGRWEDRTEWYQIALVTSEGEIPLFVAGQLERREPFMRGWFEFVNESLAQWGLREDVHEKSRKALEQVVGVFRSAGKALPLA